MKREIIYTDKAPKPGNYSQAIKYGNLIFVSGQTSDDIKTGKPIYGSVAEQTEYILNNIKFILEAAGSEMDKVLKCTVFLSSLRHKKEFEEVYKTYFSKNPPARITVGVKEIDARLDVEIDVIASI
ncbi:MAG: Endoribonuclease L-PSP [Parcubacteria bacterium 34_609]|nr:MAG: Endoribonuclease L-PSP [Parcubacteria bacterium 34_609]